MIKKDIKIRICRPTHNLEEITKMYTDGLGFEVIGGFDGHGDFNGRMIGHPNHSYHLEFTQHKTHVETCKPSEDNLLIFYVPDTSEFYSTIADLKASGFKKVKSFNPYWDGAGATFEDIDGYRIVINNSDSPF